MSDFTFTFHFRALEKEMATHSSVPAWRIPGTGEPWWAAVSGVAQSQTRLSDFTFTFHFRALEKEMASSQTPLSTPSPSHPPDHPSATALSAMLHASNLNWSSISHMVIYMFQCYSLTSSHPRLLRQSPKVCSLYLCHFCCLAHRVIVTIFLNSICMC